MTIVRTLAIAVALAISVERVQAQRGVPFGIRVVDAESGRGVPLMELRTVNDIRSVTDNAGWIAFDEPGLMGREVYFHVSGPGYEMEKDGFGFRGIRTKPEFGKTATFKVRRTQEAERIGRLTGQGMYRDSELLGQPVPVPNLMAEVMGQDSVQAVSYRDRIFWLWGDTNNPQYPLGNYQTTCATTPRVLNPERGIVYDYLMDPQKPDRLRHMMPMSDPGAVWLFGLLVLPDEAGRERMLCHWGRHSGLAPPVEQGIAFFDDDAGVFKSLRSLDPKETWRFPRGCAVRVKSESGDFFYFSGPFLHTRVRANEASVCDPSTYEAWAFDVPTQSWSWQRNHNPTTASDESKLLDAGKMKPEMAHFHLTDVRSGKRVSLHRASIEWNEWRKAWVLIGVQNGGKEDPSALGEVWYAESEAPEGPWRKAIKVASHPRYSFYNPVHHRFLDADGGRVVYFQGTYSLEFSGNPLAPARYDYNQLMYRLDLGGDWIQLLGGKERR